MSRSLAAVAVALAWAFSAGPLHATSAVQEAPYLSVDERARIRLEVAELEGSVQAIRDALVRAAEMEARQLEAPSAGRTTRVVGSVELRSAPEFSDALVDAARSALDEFGGLLEGYAAPTRLKLDVYDRAELVGRRPADGLAPGWRVVPVRPDVAADMVRREVRSWVAWVVPGSIGAWSGGRGWASTYDPGLGLFALARARDPDAISCLQGGDLDACSRFFFLDYNGSVESRRAALEESFSSASTQEQALDGPFIGAAQIQSCVEDLVRMGSADARGECIASIAEREAAALDLLPGGAAARSSLVAHAVRLAPPGGYLRLAALPNDSPIGTQLETLAEVPLAELLASWRQDASLGEGLFGAARRDRRGPVSLFWAGGLAMLALRSTRWRLG